MAGLRRAMVALAICAGMLAAVPAVINAQTGPPIKTTTPTMGTKGGLDRIGSTLKLVVAGTVAGVRDVYRYAKNLIVHGGKAPASSPLDGLHEGDTVLVRYGAIVGAGTSGERTSTGAEVTEGTVTSIDRRRERIAVREAKGHVQTFQLVDSDPADLSETSNRPPGTVVIEYSDGSGRRVAYLFKREPDAHR
jgi:hypothetical protein